jgi:dienelactone hydrolase
MRRARRIGWTIAVVLLLKLSAAGGFWWWYSTRDYATEFLQRRGRLVEAQRIVVNHGARTTTWDLTLLGDRGLRVNARLRVPDRDGQFTAVLLAAGLETGQRVIDLIEEQDDLVMIAMDYGWTAEFDVTTVPKMTHTLRRLKAVTAECVPKLLLGLEQLAREPKANPERIVVVGVSYGSYFALPAAALEPRVSRLILVQGGGEIGASIAANTGRWQAPLPPRAAGWLGEALLLPFQPERWIGRVAPRPVTFIASRTDPQFPAGVIEDMFARAREPKELIWHDTPHVDPDAAAIIAELSRVVLDQIAREPTGRADASATP